MNLVRCNNGHFFDADKYSSCPHCASNTNNRPIDRGDTFNPEYNFWDNFNFGNMGNDEGISTEKMIDICSLENKTTFEFVPQELIVFKNKSKLKYAFEYVCNKSDDYIYIIGLPYDYDIKTLIIRNYGVSYETISHFEYKTNGSLTEEQLKELYDYEKELCYLQSERDALLKFLESSVEKHDSIDECMAEWDKCKKKYDTTVEKINECRNCIDKINKERSGIEQNLKGIKIKLNTPEVETPCRFEIEILVGSITWQPEYVVEIIGDDTASIKLKGMLSSNYEIDISNASIVLSTGMESSNSAKNADKYILKKATYDITPAAFMMDGHSIAENSKFNGKADRSTMAPINEAPIVNNIENNEKKDEYTGNKTYIIENNMDIISGEVTEVLINMWPVSMIKKYIAISSKNSYASMLIRTEGFKEILNRGTKVRLYYNGEYSGLDMSDNLIDNSIIVFGQVRDIKIDKEILISKKEKVTFKKLVKEHNKYQIRITNEMGRDVEVYVVDNIPISFDEDIVVDVINSDNATIVKDKGIANWDISVQSGATKEITVEYTVTYPENVIIDRIR